MKELDEFLANWPDTAEGNRGAFAALKAHLEGLAGVRLDFIARPGITYSLRAKHEAQQRRELFVMVDVIEDSPRWLSVCFYRDLAGDPESLGDEVPEGLLGEDAVCFDLETADPTRLAYIKSRIDEAHAAAAKG